MIMMQRLSSLIRQEVLRKVIETTIAEIDHQVPDSNLMCMFIPKMDAKEYGKQSLI